MNQTARSPVGSNSPGKTRSFRPDYSENEIGGNARPHPDPLPQERVNHTPDSGAGELVATLVVGMTGVTLEPAPVDLVAGALCLELTPQVVVLHGFAVQRAPALDLPTRQPLRDAIAQILGVGKERHLARFLERAQRFNRRFAFHA